MNESGHTEGTIDPEPPAFHDWNPRDYLRDYYREILEDERHTMRYFVERIRDAPVGPVLVFGCGPALHHVFLTVPRMTELHLADYLPQNLEEIEAWRRRESGAHDWTAFVRYTLSCEGRAAPDERQIAERVEAVRLAIRGLVRADAALVDPLGASFRGRFAAVVSAYCADSATADKEVWRRYSRNIASLVRPGGMLLTAALRRSLRYRVGDRYFPSANVDESDLRAVLERDFHPESVEVQVREVPAHRGQGYSGILLASATKAPKRAAS